jgi:hypothetical protein
MCVTCGTCPGEPLSKRCEGVDDRLLTEEYKRRSVDRTHSVREWDIGYGLKGNWNRSWRRTKGGIRKLGGPRYTLCFSGFADSGDGELWFSS